MRLKSNQAMSEVWHDEKREREEEGIEGMKMKQEHFL